MRASTFAAVSGGSRWIAAWVKPPLPLTLHIPHTYPGDFGGLDPVQLLGHCF
jgi:hypothetical protein